MEHQLQCKCGAVSGTLHEAHRAHRGICYCKDCRAYSKHLGKLSETHDSAGGADFVAASTRQVTFKKGIENIACLSLSTGGLLRWYAKCCNTPICNTARSWKIPYVGIVRACLDTQPGSYERTFPKVQMRVHRGSALVVPPSQSVSTLLTLVRLMPSLLLDRVNGGYRKTPLFIGPGGSPITEVVVLTPGQRQLAYNAA